MISYGDEMFRVDFTKHTGTPVVIYGQTEFTRDLYEARENSGGRIEFNVENVSIQRADTNTPHVDFVVDGEHRRLDCDFIAGCDGFHGVSRQADAAGLYPSANETRGKSDPNFTGCGCSPGNMDTGEFTFETVKPGAVPFGGGGMQAPHITAWVAARGINIGLHMRIYFEDEAEANASDPILTRIEHQNRIPTLLAKKETYGRYRFDIHLQGPDETIFFDI